MESSTESTNSGPPVNQARSGMLESGDWRVGGGLGWDDAFCVRERCRRLSLFFFACYVHAETGMFNASKQAGRHVAALLCLW